MDVTSGGDLAHHEALHFTFALDVDNILTIWGDGDAGGFAGLRELFDVHVLRGEDGVTGGVRFAEGEDDRDYGDENDGSPGNQIPTIFAGQMVKPGRYGQAITHYGVLRTIEKLYRLPPLGQARTAHPITDVWRRGQHR